MLSTTESSDNNVKISKHFYRQRQKKKRDRLTQVKSRAEEIGLDLPEDARYQQILESVEEHDSKEPHDFKEREHDVENKEEPKEELLVYESKFGNRIKSLRRISFASSLTCIGFLGGIAAGLSEASSLNLSAQYAIVGTTCFTSVNATLILKAITEPYVLKLWEQLPQPKDEKDHNKRRFKAKTVNVYGMEVETTFSLNDVSKSSHPFATCMVKDKSNDADNGKSLYIFDKLLLDKNLKTHLIKKQ